MTSIKWNGKEVQNPVRRKLVVALIIIVLPIALVVILPIGLAVGTILHPFLKLLGLKGVYRTEGRYFVIKLDREAFRPA